MSISKTTLSPKDVDISISEISDGIYRICGLVDTYGITFNHPNMVFPMHGSCIDKSMFGQYTDAILKNDFAYANMLLGHKMEYDVT